MFKRILELIFNVKKIKAFMTSKDALVFLFFLLLSFCFWYLHGMRKKYELEIPVRIQYSNVPINIINEEDLPHNITVTVKDQGFYLLLYKTKEIEPVTLNLKLLKKSSKQFSYISNENIKYAIKKKLLNSSEIIKTNPEEIYIKYVKKAEKILKVIYRGDITFDQQYSLSDSVKIEPSRIRVFGDKHIVDTMNFVYIDNVNFKNLKDTVNRTIQITKKPFVQFFPRQIKIFIPVDKFTEQTLEVQITGKNLPSHMIIRTFPATMKVTFFITFSRFNSINRNNIEATIDYNTIINSKTGKQKPIVKINNPFIFNIRTDPSEVEYLLEYK